MELFDVVTQKRCLHESIPLPSVLSLMVVEYTTFPILKWESFTFPRKHVFVGIVNHDLYTCHYKHHRWILYRNKRALSQTFTYPIKNVVHVKQDWILAYDDRNWALLYHLKSEYGTPIYPMYHPVVYKQDIYFMCAQRYYRYDYNYITKQYQKIWLHDIDTRMICPFWKVIGNCMSLSNYDNKTQFMGESNVYDGCAVYKWNDIVYVIKEYAIVCSKRIVPLPFYPSLILAYDHLLVVGTHEKGMVWDLKHDVINECDLPKLQVTHDGMYCIEIVNGRHIVRLFP